MPFALRCDMRQIPRKGLLGKLEVFDAEARAHFNVANVERSYQTEGTDLIVTWLPASERGAPDMAQLASTLDAAVDRINSGVAVAGHSEILVVPTKQINGETIMAGPVTGAKALGNMFRGHLAEIKSQIDKAGQEMNIAMGDLKETATQATEMVKAVKAETADLKASLGLHSNNPPEDVDGA